jgi:hypothetical protein
VAHSQVARKLGVDLRRGRTTQGALADLLRPITAPRKAQPSTGSAARSNVE